MWYIVHDCVVFISIVACSTLLDYNWDGYIVPICYYHLMTLFSSVLFLVCHLLPFHELVSVSAIL